MSTRLSSALLAGLAVAGVSLTAQQTTPTFRSATHLVRVDAVVVDASGAPVLDLSAADFTLLDRGKPQTISAFEEIRHAPVAAASRPAGHQDVSGNVADNKSQLMVLVLDDAHIRKEWTAHAREIVEDFVRDLDGDTMIAMLSTTGKFNVEVTSDRQLVLDALDHFSGQELPLAYMAPGGSVSAAPRPMAPGLSPEEAARYHVSTTPKRPPAMNSTAAGCPEKGGLEGVWNDSLTLYRLLEHASKILGSEQTRHKALGWISTGESFVAQGLPDAIAQMHRAGVATYAIDPVGTARVIPKGDYDSSGCAMSADKRTPWQVVADNKHTSLTRTARESGGEAIINDDDFGAGVRKIVTDFGSYYSLGFYPDDLTTAGVRPLDVSVNRPGVSVRARLSYDLADLAPVTPEAALDVMSSGLVPKGDLPLRLYAAALPNAANGGRIVAMLEVTSPPAPQDASASDAPDRLPYSIMAVDLSTGEAVARFSNEASINLVRRGGFAASSPRSAFVLRTGFTLPPGHYQLRASAASQRTGAAGSVFRTLDVPDYRNSPLAISDIVVGEASTPPIDSTNTVAAAIIRSIPVVATLARTFRAGQSIHLYAEIATKRPAAVSSAVLALVGPDGQEAWRTTQPLTGTEHKALDLALPVPLVTPGPYALRLSVTDGAHTVIRDIAIVVGK
jgi:VWFA-related protein